MIVELRYPCNAGGGRPINAQLSLVSSMCRGDTILACPVCSFDYFANVAVM